MAEMAKTVVTMGGFAAGGYVLGRAAFQVPKGHKAVVYNEQEDSVGEPLDAGFHIRIPFIESPWVYNMEPVAREVRSAPRSRDGRPFECVLECEVSLMEDRLDKYRGIDRDQYLEKVFPPLGKAAMAFAAQSFNFSEIAAPVVPDMEIVKASEDKKGGLGSWLASFGAAGGKQQKEEKEEYIKMNYLDRRRQLTKQADLKFRELADKFDLKVHGPVFLPTLETEAEMRDLSEGVANIMMSGQAEAFDKQFEGKTDKEIKEILTVAADKLGIKMEDRPAQQEDEKWHMRVDPRVTKEE
jgi:hypothetical protein